jgi:outer membrane protein OmpA-like peptidoglycan-associated protein
VTARAAGLLGLLVLAGCAAPPPAAKPVRDDLVVLLPDQDGKTGALAVTHGGTERVLDTPYAAARVKEVGRLETGASTPDEVQRVFAEALAAQPPRPVSFLLYFLEGQDTLTPESQQVVQQIFAEIARRPSPEIVIIGHTDRVGSVAANDALSLRRAQKVRDDLVKLGIPADRMQVAGRGEREPLVPTEDEVPEPRNRRVEISVR